MKRVFLFLFFVSNSLIAQSNLPSSANDISPLLIGEKVPTLSLKDTNGKSVNISDLISSKKTILVFYRGGWCPYCSTHLSALGETELQLIAQGYQIVAISPDSPKSLMETQTKGKLNYTLLSDSDGEFAKAFGIAFQAPENYGKYLKKSSENLNTDLYIPVPSLFILNQSGTILFEYISPDYKQRITNDLLLSVVKSL